MRTTEYIAVATLGGLFWLSSAGVAADQFIEYWPDGIVQRSVLDAFLSKRKVARYSVVTFDSDRLRESIRRSTADGAEPEPFTLSVFDDPPLTYQPNPQLVKEHYETWRSGMATWAGRIPGDERAFAIITIAADNTVLVKLNSTNGYYQIDKLGEGPYHILWQKIPSTQDHHTD